jgi:uncharacterized protein (DUF885 family)
MHQFDRRRLLAAGASAAVLAGPALAKTAAHPAHQAAGERLHALLDAFLQEDLRRRPEQATNEGLDVGLNAGLRSKWGDVSTKGMEADRAYNAERLARLKTIDRKALSGPEKIDYDTMIYVAEATQPILDLMIGGRDGFSPSPYVLSPITGAYQRVPDFMNTRQKVESQADAEAYLARLSGFATLLDDNTERLRVDTGHGVVPPDFLLDGAILQLGQLVVSADQSKLVTRFDERAKAKGLGDGWGPKAAQIYTSKVRPALERQIAALKHVRASAGHDAGVWRFEKGPAFYRANLKFTTTTNMTPEEVHKLGLDEGAEISARLDGLLKAQGLSQGTVGERVRALYKDPAQFYPNTPEGKKALIDSLQAKLEVVKARLPRFFNHIPSQQIEVRPVPPEIDAGAPHAYSQAPSLDHKRPGMIFFNLHDTMEWPKWELSSTLYHEGLPGHQLQGGIAQESKIPTIRRSMYFSGYGEGWALYAEQLADELGMYEDDPLGRIGWLKAQLFRAGRCVTDTGIHHMRWSREQAIEYLTGLDGDAEASTAREVERYCAIPAQACSYKIGHTYWVGQRAKAQAKLGAAYDIKAFHDAGLDEGAMPLDVLGMAIDAYIASAQHG